MMVCKKVILANSSQILEFNKNNNIELHSVLIKALKDLEKILIFDKSKSTKVKMNLKHLLCQTVKIIKEDIKNTKKININQVNKIRENVVYHLKQPFGLEQL